MRERYLKDQLEKHGLTVLTPESEDDQKQIFQYIMDELGFNVFKPAMLAFFKGQVDKLRLQGAQGVFISPPRPGLDCPSLLLLLPARTRMPCPSPCGVGCCCHTVVILGCTEIELLIKQKDVPDVPLFPSAELHIDAAAAVAAGK